MEQARTYNPEQMESDASVFQMLQGGNAADNPYIAYLQPREVVVDGKRFLRVPKNQTMVDLAKFFDEHGKTVASQKLDAAKEFLKYRQNQFQNTLDAKKTEYDIKKPYFKPTAPKVTQGKTKKQKNTVGGLSFTQQQSDGSYKPITAAEYATLNGLNLVDVLMESGDPGDQQVIADTQALEEMVANGEISIEDALAALREDYPHVYGSSS